MVKPVSLAVHRNNSVQRRAKKVRSMLKEDVRSLLEMPDIAGYAVIAWDEQRGYRADWYTPRSGPIPSSVMPEYIKVSMLRDLARMDTKRDLDSG